MDQGFSIVAFTAMTFLLAGFAKGVIGLGLPTVAIGLLSLIMTPAQAVVLLVVPTLVTNVWQAAAGPHLGTLLRRLWPMHVAICLGTFAGVGLLTSSNAHAASAALGTVLLLYALLGLTAVEFSVPKHAEFWLAPLIGIATGVVAVATGVFGIPAVPYQQAIGLEKEELVQALGLSFTVSTLALTADLAYAGMLQWSATGLSVLALAPAFAGMLLGQVVRARVRPDVFRRCFFIGMLLLGAHLALRALL